MVFFDLHAHYLPGLDDGPSNLAETMELLSRAVDGGTRAIVATPHLYHPSFPDVSVAVAREAFAATVQAVRTLAGDRIGSLELVLGSENFVSARFLTALEKGEVIPIGEHLLIELPPLCQPVMIQSAVERVRSAGYLPILAHVERYATFRRDLRLLEGLVAAGCVAQVNGRSLIDGPAAIRRFTRKLLKKGLVHVVASDAHDLEDRGPELGVVGAYLSRKFGEEKAHEWLATAPARLAGLAG